LRSAKVSRLTDNALPGLGMARKVLRSTGADYSSMWNHSSASIQRFLKGRPGLPYCGHSARLRWFNVANLGAERLRQSRPCSNQSRIEQTRSLLALRLERRSCIWLLEILGIIPVSNSCWEKHLTSIKRG